jgi:nitrile hydratase accessory protein
VAKSTDPDSFVWPAKLPAKLDDGPPFQTPWQARAFGVAVSMCQAGYYTWDEFRDRLIAEIAQHPGEPAEYYQCWLNALEKLLAEKGFVPGSELNARTQELATPKTAGGASSASS